MLQKSDYDDLMNGCQGKLIPDYGLTEVSHLKMSLIYILQERNYFIQPYKATYSPITMHSGSPDVNCAYS